MVKYVPKRDGSRTVLGKNGIVGNLPGDKALGSGNEESLAIDKDALVSEPTVEDSLVLVDDVDNFHKAYMGLTAPSATVALKDDPPAPVVKPLSELPAETVDAARRIGESFGMAANATDEMLRKAESVTPHYGGDEYDFLNESDTAEFVSNCVSYSENNNASEKLLRDVREGRIALTRRDLACLAGVRDLIQETQARDSLDYAGDNEWMPSVEQRNCHMCGQFIGLRSTHLCDGKRFPADHIRAALSHKRDTADLGEAPGELFMDGRDIEVSSRSYRKLGRDIHRAQPIVGLSEEEMQDIYYSLYLTRSDVILSYADKKMFKTAKIELPPSIRKAFLEEPMFYRGEGYYSDRPELDEGVSRYTIKLVASLIEPPLQRHEIVHLLEAGGPMAARALLDVKRTNADTKDIIENNPSDGAAGLAYSGELNEDTLRSMASSPDPLVQREAAIAPNLPEESLKELLASPHADVRKALAVGRLGLHDNATNDGNHWSLHETIKNANSNLYKKYDSPVLVSALDRNPSLLTPLLSDPDDSIAVEALKASPKTRNTMRALGTVASRQRLQILKNALLDQTSEAEESITGMKRRMRSLHSMGIYDEDSRSVDQSIKALNETVKGSQECLVLIDRRLGQ